MREGYMLFARELDSLLADLGVLKFQFWAN
jgi:hypothetical protein